MDSIQGFWNHFRERHGRLAPGGTMDDQEFDALLAELHRIEPGLFLLLCVGATPKELIVTAEGKRELFSTAEDVVAQAPTLEGWTFLALKPKLGFPDTAEWEGYSVAIDQVSFKPLERPEGTLGLRLFVPRLRSQDAERAHNAILRALDVALGERRFADLIDGTEVAARPRWLDTMGLRPLKELEEVLKGRWKTAQTTHEGFPLLLRAPAGLEYDSLRKRFPRLLVATHRLARVQPSGLPEPDYNRSLEEFDHHLVGTFESLEQGVTVLVETYAGKRIYYSYIASTADLEAQKHRTRARFPDHDLAWEAREDPDWRFIRKYARAYGL